jgi:outer membrane protein
MKRISYLVVVFVGLIASQTYAQKIGHVDLEKIVLDMPAYKNAMDSVKIESKKVEVKLKKMESEFERATRIYQDSAKLWSLGTRQIKQNELAYLEKSYKEYYQISSMGLDSVQQLAVGRIIKKVKKAAKEVAKEKGFSYVLNYSEQAQLVLYYEEGHDITAAVRKKLGLL